METSSEATIHDCNKIIRTGDVLEPQCWQLKSDPPGGVPRRRGGRISVASTVGVRSLNVSVACQFCDLLAHFLTVYYLVTVVDSSFITRFHVISSTVFLILAHHLHSCHQYLFKNKIHLTQACNLHGAWGTCTPPPPPPSTQILTHIVGSAWT